MKLANFCLNIFALVYIGICLTCTKCTVLNCMAASVEYRIQPMLWPPTFGSGWAIVFGYCHAAKCSSYKHSW